jgi:hypothetical protein
MSDIAACGLSYQFSAMSLQRCQPWLHAAETALLGSTCLHGHTHLAADDLDPRKITATMAS